MTINDELRAMRERVEAMECGDAEWSYAADHLKTTRERVENATEGPRLNP